MNLNKTTSKWMKIILGLFLIGYALNQFFHFFPTSYGSMPENAESFLNAVAIYLPVLYIFEIIIGLFLLFNKWSTFILIVMFPLSVAFLIFNFSNQDLIESWPALLTATLNILLIISEKEKYKVLFS